MSPFAYIALFGCGPHHHGPVRAHAGACGCNDHGDRSTLLLPLHPRIPSLPDYSKATAASIGLLLGLFIFDSNRLSRFRPRWYDLPMLVWCFSGIASALANGLSLYDGLSDAQAQCSSWGLPYLFGRLYFGNLEGMRSYCAGIVGGGLLYSLLCLYEIVMTPHLWAASMALQSTRGHGARTSSSSRDSNWACG